MKYLLHAEAQADGPIIQLANIESIKNGINFEKVIHILKQAEEHCNIKKHMVRQTFGQLIYWNPVENDYHYNINKF